MLTFFRSLILLVLILVQGIYGFCIYNKFTDGTSFTINQNDSGVLQAKVFKKHMETGSIACCHYTNTDCSRRKRNNDPIQFIISFQRKRDTSPSLKIAICATGGALVLSGSQEEHFATCIYTNGVSLPIRLLDSYNGHAFDPF